ncbi:hypothetical protein [Corallococcus macrosporus]|uniref:hypothetical protein n=1 Tax=Corallococcus macrosporus TaxID=35 RepID=UPI00030AE155|nr:hypothetical protein [Corallococcus macrosporus]
MNKAVSVFMDMDKRVGASFEEGLATLKDLSEAKAAEQAGANAAPNGAVMGDAAK